MADTGLAFLALVLIGGFMLICGVMVLALWTAVTAAWRVVKRLVGWGRDTITPTPPTPPHRTAPRNIPLRGVSFRTGGFVGEGRMGDEERDSPLIWEV